MLPVLRMRSKFRKSKLVSGFVYPFLKHIIQFLSFTFVNSVKCKIYQLIWIFIQIK